MEAVQKHVLGLMEKLEKRWANERREKEEEEAEAAEEERARLNSEGKAKGLDPAWFASDEFTKLFRTVYTSGHAQSGNSPELAEAAFDGEMQTVKELLLQGYDLESHDANGFTALNGASGVDTFVVGGKAYAIVAAYYDHGVQLIEI